MPQINVMAKATPVKPTSEQPTQVTKEMFDTLQEALRGVSLSWATHLVTFAKPYITDHPEFKPFSKVDRRKVYNVFNDVVRDNSWRVFIYALGTEWLRVEKARLADLLSGSTE